MMPNTISSAQIRRAAVQVRQSMLSSAQVQSAPAHEFSPDFQARIRALKVWEQRRRRRWQIVRRCAAAALAVVLGIAALLAANETVRADVAAWFRERILGRTTYYFSGESTRSVPDFEIGWMPEGIEFVREESSAACIARLYQDPNEFFNGFTIQCGLMTSGSALFTGYSDARITEVTINGQYGELYVSLDPKVRHSLVWLDEENNVHFAISSFLEPDVILHIAESVKLS